ncbi:MAG: carbohydrate kinase [bacterium]|nr:carbohydrate kinase [bacterium]
MRIIFIGQVSKDINIFKSREQVIPGGGVYYGAFVSKAFLADTVVYTKLAEEDRKLFKDMEDYGINVIWFPSRITTTIQNIYPTDNPDDRRSKMINRAEPFTNEEIENVKDADIIHISGLWHGEILEIFIEKLRKKASILGLDAQGFLRNVDSEGNMVYKDWEYKEKYLPLIDVFKVDSREAEVLTGIKDHYRAIEEISKWGSREVLLTYRDGVVLWAQGKVCEEKFGGWTLEGRTGRGDTCMAGYLIHKHLGSEIALKKTAEIATEKMRNPGPYRRKG